MHKPMKTTALLILLFFVTLTGCSGPQTVIVTVRHAEKVLGVSDPDLTPAGQARAEALATRLAGANIQAVYSTDTRRTRQTATPMANALGLTVQTYTSPAQIASRVMSEHLGQNVLVVGHSNTVGSIVTAFGAELPDELPQPINEDDFDNLVTIFVNGDRGAGAVHTTYGAPSP